MKSALAADTGKVGTGPQAEGPPQIKLANQPVHRSLPVLALDLAQQEPHSISIVTATEYKLLGNDLSGAVKGHGRSFIPKGVGIAAKDPIGKGQRVHGASAPGQHAQRLKGASFLGTATLSRVTYWGRPFS